MSTQVAEVVTDRQIETIEAMVPVTTGIDWTKHDARVEVANFLAAWQEPTNPLYDPRNYALGYAGKFPLEAFAAVPFVVALGGLMDRCKVMPERFHEVAVAFHNTVNTDFDIYKPRMNETVDAVRRSVHILESLGFMSIGRNNEARTIIRKSDFFSRKQLREIVGR